MPAPRPAFARQDTDAAISSEKSYSNDEKSSPTFEKGETVVAGTELPSYGGNAESGHHGDLPPSTAEDLVTEVITLEDDPTQNVWTFRMFFLGIGFSIFGSVLQEIFYFKPQVIFVSVVFLTVLAYVLGEAMAALIPRWGVIGKWFNPHPFNMKEHAAITLMASAATQSALATQALAAQQLFYGGYPNHAAGVFITISSQLIGFGIAGLLRDVLVYPTRMLWPMNLPITSLLESLHKDKREARQKLKVFYWIFGVVFVWEVFPEYIFTVLEGVSIFCLAQQNSLVFTNLFGGASGNEGLGFLSISFDWQYVASLGSPLWMPLYTLTNSLIGYLGCIMLFMGLYYSNTYRAQDFPFLAQMLLDGSSNSTNFVTYNQSLILNPDFTINEAALDQVGIPWLTPSYVGYLLTSNMGLTAVFTHMLLWNFEDIKAGWVWANPTTLKFMLKSWKFWEQGETPEERLERKEADPLIDPHYKLMLRNKYKEVPLWWWFAVLVASFIMGMVCLYVMNSTLPWWGFIVAILISFVFMLFFGALYGLTGFAFNLQPACQTFAGYMFPNRPLANMYFTCYTYNAVSMGQILARDLKLAQYVHLAPRATYMLQVVGAFVGAVFNYIMMLTIVEAQAPILQALQGSNIWSGQNIQQFNTMAIAWSIAGKMFSIGARYQWVTIAYLVGFLVPIPIWLANRFYPHKAWGYINLGIILWYMGWLFVGINASITSYFILGFGAQWWLRKKHPQFFIKYNYIVSAALDGGTQVLVFILTFAVFGGSGNAVPFPIWGGNPDTSIHNLDYCAVNPANG